MKKAKKILSTIKNIICWAVLITLIVCVALILISKANGKTPSIAGYSFFRVSSESMTPELEIGDVILVKECDAYDLKVGDVVTYNGTEGEFAGKIITHRVMETPYEYEGDMYITTKGDAVDDIDPRIKTTQVIGKMQKELPLFTKAFNFFITPYGLFAVILLIVLAFFGDIVNFIKALTNTGIDEEKESIEEIVERIKKEDAENYEKMNKK